MNEELQNQIEQIIDKKMQSFTNLSVPAHRHNRVDSPQVASANLLPYPTDTTIWAIQPENPNGTIRYWNFTENDTPVYSYGEFIYLNNQQNRLFISDFHLSSASVYQTIANGDTDTIIFQLPFQVAPSGAYDNTTGIFSSVNNSNGISMVYEGWVSVTSTVLLDVGIAGGTFTISIIVDGGVESSVTYKGVAESFTLAIAMTMYMAGFKQMEIKVTNDSGFNRDIIGLLENLFTIKQLK